MASGIDVLGYVANPNVLGLRLWHCCVMHDFDFHTCNSTSLIINIAWIIFS